MGTNDLTCEQVDARDLDGRYLAGTLSGEEAEAFEQHYFGCDRCWALVEQGAAVRAALEAEPLDREGVAHPRGADAASAPSDANVIPLAERAGAATRRRGYRRPRVLPALLAASLVIAAFGIYQSAQSRRRVNDDTERGAQGSLAVSLSRRSADSIVAAWPHVSGAVRYRSRVFTSTGTLLVERDSPDTFAVQLASDLAKRRPRAGAQGDSASRLFWNVEAVDAHGAVIAKSALTPLTPLARGR